MVDHTLRSARTGITWPALPGGADAIIMAIHSQLERSQWLPAEQLRALQMHQLESLLSHAAKTVPFQDGRLETIAGMGRGELTAEAWRRIPVMGRADIQDAGETLFSRNPPSDHGKTKEITTSGSTGRPIAVRTTTVTALYQNALNLRYHLWHERDFSATVAAIHVLGPEQMEAAGTDRELHWIGALGRGRIFFCDIRASVVEQLEWLARHQPRYILTYPSNLHALVRRSLDSGWIPPDLHHVVTLGEVLEPFQRLACEEHWKAPVTDSYSAQEVGLIAIQCPQHPHYHVQTESVFVEILDAAGEPCGPGEIGRVVVTDLHNFATPLIRYHIDDYAEVGPPCPCGRGLPVLSRIMGRTRNMLALPDGDAVWPLFYSDWLAEVAPVRQAQLVQRSLQELEMLLVVSRPPTAAEEDALRTAILTRLRHSFSLKFTYVDEISRSPGGKYEDFRSEVPIG